MHTFHNSPLVTVLTAVHNAERFISATIESILNQTFSDFEYILINDQSTDNTPTLLAHYAAQDPRIRVLHTSQQLGPSGALNFGIQAARGLYLANLDHDDLSMPERLAKQVAFLEQNPAIGAVGANLLCIDEDSMPIAAGAPNMLERKHLVAPSPATSRWVLHFQPALHHCTQVVRHEAINLIGGYSLRYRYICDYDLQVRLAEHIDMVNLPECLAAYRVHNNQTSRRHRTEQNGMYFLRIAATMRRTLNERVAPDEVAAYYHSTDGTSVTDEAMLHRVASLLERLYQRFIASHSLTLGDLAWVRLSYASYLNHFAQVNKRGAVEGCELLFERVAELQELAKAPVG